MAGAVQDVATSTTLTTYAEAQAGRCQRMTKDAEQFMMCQDDEDKEMASPEFDMVR